MTAETGRVAPGWYPDQRRRGWERWWNGHDWTDHARCVEAPAQMPWGEKQPKRVRTRREKWTARVVWSVLAVLVVGGTIGALLGGGTKSDSAAGSHWKAQTYPDDGSGVGWAIKIGSGWTCGQALGGFICAGGHGAHVEPGSRGAYDVAMGISDATNLSVRYDEDRWRCANVLVNGKVVCTLR